MGNILGCCLGNRLYQSTYFVYCIWPCGTFLTIAIFVYQSPICNMSLLFSFLSTFVCNCLLFFLLTVLLLFKHGLPSLLKELPKLWYFWPSSSSLQQLLSSGFQCSQSPVLLLENIIIPSSESVEALGFSLRSLSSCAKSLSRIIYHTWYPSPTWWAY